MNDDLIRPDLNLNMSSRASSPQLSPSAAVPIAAQDADVDRLLNLAGLDLAGASNMPNLDDSELPPFVSRRPPLVFVPSSSTPHDEVLGISKQRSWVTVARRLPESTGVDSTFIDREQDGSVLYSE